MKKNKSLSRRGFLRTGMLGLGGVTVARLLGKSAWADEGGQKPNILYIFTDQQWAGAMSCAGNPDVKTPAMDSLAASGVRFAQAYSAHPLCSPCRASMLTGFYPHQIGIMDNDNAIIPESVRNEEVGILLEKAGYECVYGGKWHLPKMSMTDPEAQEHGFRLLSDMNDQQVAQTAVEFLKAGHDKPFFMMLSFLNPHDICAWKPLKKKDPNEASYPELPANFEIPEDEPDVIREQQKLEDIYQRCPDFKPEHCRHYRDRYYQYTEKVDWQIGEVLSALHDQGLDKNTVVVLSSDHGDAMGAHQWTRKRVLYEESVRVPFMVSHPGVTQAGAVDDEHLISNGPDVYATILDYAGVPMPSGRLGRSVRALAEGRELTEPWREELAAETCFKAGVQGRMIRNAQYKYMVYNSGKQKEQLIDLKADPGEMKNLVKDPEYGEVLQSLKDRLSAWQKQTSDSFDPMKETRQINVKKKPAKR